MTLRMDVYSVAQIVVYIIGWLAIIGFAMLIFNVVSELMRLV